MRQRNAAPHPVGRMVRVVCADGDGVKPGLRTYKQASCRIHAPDSVPTHLQGAVRELLSLHSDNQGNGEARALMRRVCREADQCRMVLMLTAKPFEAGLPEPRLKAFYRRFGFFVASETAPDLMIRAPRKSH